LTKAFAEWKNLKVVILALLGLVAGQAVVWYTGQFYALFFLTQTVKLDGATANILVAIALLLGTPFFVIFGSLSDKIGRKPIIMAGLALAVLTYFPLFKMLVEYGNPALAAAQEKAPVVVIADPAACSFQFNPVGTAKFTSSCDIAKSFLARNSVNYRNESAGPGALARIKVGEIVVEAFEATGLSKDDAKKASDDFNKSMTDAIRGAGYPAKADMAVANKPMIVLVLFILVVYVTMVYAPIAAILVELFPTRIRYTSMSLPYHIGNGWFGGFLPTTAFAMVAATGDIYYGLWYPIIVAAVTLVIGLIFVKETKDIDIYAAD